MGSMDLRVAAYAVVTDDDDRLLLARWIEGRRVAWTMPGGGLEAGESPEDAVRRELREETGYTARDWRFVCTIHNAIAYSDELLDIYLARGLVAGESALDEGEFLETMTASVDELLQWVREGKITDVKTVIGSFWLEKIVSGSWNLDQAAPSEE